MAKQLVLQNLMKLAQGIGANPQKFMGTRTNISFLGKGPTKNPLFQGPLQGLESASEAQLGSRESIISTVEDAMGYATANKLNSIQIRALELNLESIFKIYNPPPLPMASISPIRSGIKSLRKSPPRAQEIMDDMAMIEDPASLAEIPQKTASARATMIRLLDVYAGGQPGVGITLREMMSPKELKWLMEGGGGTKGDPITLFTKFYGNASAKQLPSEGTPAVIDAFAKRLLQAKDNMGRRVDDPFFRKEDIDFAGGGLAHILQVPRSGYSKGRAVKSLMGLVNKKFGKGTLKKASDLSKGTKHEELEAVKAFEQRHPRVDDLGGYKIVEKDFDFSDMHILEPAAGLKQLIIKKYKGRIDDKLLQQMLADDNPQRLAEVMATVDEALAMQAKGMGPESIMASFKESWKRKPNASGGLAGILEV